MQMSGSSAGKCSTCGGVCAYAPVAGCAQLLVRGVAAALAPRQCRRSEPPPLPADVIKVLVM
jgi:hypothetical protein